MLNLSRARHHPPTCPSLPTLTPRPAFHLRHEGGTGLRTELGETQLPPAEGGRPRPQRGQTDTRSPGPRLGPQRDCGAEAQTGGRLGPEPGGAGGGLDPAGVPKAGHWMGVKAFQAEEERVQKHKYEGAVGHGASPWGSVGERIKEESALN